MGQNPLCTSGDLCRGREISAPALLSTLLHVLLLEGRSQLHPREGGDVQLGHRLLLGLLGATFVTSSWDAQAPRAIRQAPGRGMLCPSTLGVGVLAQHRAACTAEPCRSSACQLQHRL